MRKAVHPSRRADAAGNRGRIMEAARGILAERGLAAEVMQIAERAGVGAGTLYRNFPTRQHLIAAVVGEMSRSFEEAVAEAYAGTSASDALSAVIRAGFEVADQYGHLLLDLLAGGADRGFETGFDRERVRERVREICRRGVASGELPASLDVEFALGMLQGLFAPRALEFLLESHTPHQIADLAVDFYLRGLGANRLAGR